MGENTRNLRWEESKCRLTTKDVFPVNLMDISLYPCYNNFTAF